MSKPKKVRFLVHFAVKYNTRIFMKINAYLTCGNCGERYNAGDWICPGRPLEKCPSASEGIFLDVLPPPVVP
jgi:hypothetical protein